MAIVAKNVVVNEEGTRILLEEKSFIKKCYIYKIKKEEGLYELVTRMFCESCCKYMSVRVMPDIRLYNLMSVEM